jgi:hypothetical protein
MKRIVKWFALAGLIVPIVLFITSQIELYINYKRLPWSTLYGFYLWPSQIFLIGTVSGPFVIVVPLLFAIVANMLLYVIIGLVVAGTWKLFLRLRGVRGSLPAG